MTVDAPSASTLHVRFYAQFSTLLGENLIWVQTMLPVQTMRERLRAALIDVRKAQRVSQRELARRLRRPQSYVSKYECGERRLDVCELLEILEALRFDPVEFLRRLTCDTYSSAS